MLYHNTDVSAPHLFQEDMKRWWEDGGQDELSYFTEARQFISFNKDLNESQVEAIARFTGWKVQVQVQKWADLCIDVPCMLEHFVRSEVQTTSKWPSQTNHMYRYCSFLSIYLSVLQLCHFHVVGHFEVCLVVFMF